MMAHWPSELRRLARDEDGQDLVEYAFLSAFIALASLAALLALEATIGTVYSTSVSEVDLLWEPPGPG